MPIPPIRSVDGPLARYATEPVPRVPAPPAVLADAPLVTVSVSAEALARSRAAAVARATAEEDSAERADADAATTRALESSAGGRAP